MKKGLVNIAQGTPEQLAKVKVFLANSQVKYPEKKLKTHADAVVFAIEQSQKVPNLETTIEELRAKAWEEHLDYERLKEDYQKLKENIDELNKLIIGLGKQYEKKED